MKHTGIGQQRPLREGCSGLEELDRKALVLAPASCTILDRTLRFLAPKSFMSMPFSSPWTVTGPFLEDRESAVGIF